MTNEAPPPPYANWGAYRFDRALSRACEDQSLTLAEFAEAIGKSDQALRNIRYGTSSPRPDTIARIEEAAGWDIGGYEQAREGKTPTPAVRAIVQSQPTRLAFLLRVVHTKSGHPYTFRDLAKELRQGGIDITVGQVEALTETWQGAPEGIEAGLASIFGVPTSYFTDDTVAVEVERELALLAALRDTGVKNLALRAAGLSPRSLDSLARMVESAREIEGLSSAEHKRDK
ncbi:helix-turn-helix transcriptional regulator [Nocardiopsis sp. FR4]|uniref:helix-turn-helix domain-containing protein n=1 Tax=Nocardiopsis sp. FR4 TaxID=2605985 RepID=UPI001356B05E|nr:helix-turn-helix transcriptional regulator [Nocardiopsis sp. FR4]